MSARDHPRHRLRSIGAVTAGRLAAILPSAATDVVLHASGVYPPVGERMCDALFPLATSYRVVYDGVAGGYVATWLVPCRPMKHALVFGAVGVALSTEGALGRWEAGQGWCSLLIIIAIAMPCAWAGGKLRGVRAPALAKLGEVA